MNRDQTVIGVGVAAGVNALSHTPCALAALGVRPGLERLGIQAE